MGCPRSRIAIATSPTNLQRIIAFRNILIHRYSQVDDEIVWDIQQSGLLIAEITRGISFDEFNENWVVPAAVERHFTIIGEAMARLDEHHPTVATQISEHKTNIGFRIVLVHRYPEIRNQEVWESPSPTSQPSSTKSPTFPKTLGATLIVARPFRKAQEIDNRGEKRRTQRRRTGDARRRFLPFLRSKRGTRSAATQGVHTTPVRGDAHPAPHNNSTKRPHARC